VVATDFCAPMLEIAEKKRNRRKISEDDIRFLQADAQQLPFEENSFQIVSVAFGLRNVADTDLALSEMTRVCEVGGRVAVLEFSMPRWQPFSAVYGWYFRYILPRVGQLLAKNRRDAYNYLPQSVGEFPSGEKLADRMRQVGLTDVQIHPLTLGVATMYVGMK